MSSRLFTLEEANRLLPLVESITRDAVRCYRTAKEGIRAWEWLRAQQAPGPAASTAELDRKDAEITAGLERLRGLTDELEAIGCHLRDFERGVVDFPAACLGEGPFLFYCWALGESAVAYCHGEEEGFEERRAVGAGASA
jgi:hypothetical protein